jgi:hypothetical protein
MKAIKSLILGSAAGIVAMSGAQAADLPVKAKAVEYVKICSLYGTGFYYIPGTNTCIKLGGYLRADTSFNASGAYEQPRQGITTRNNQNYIARARQDLNIDTRTATEYGVVRTYFDARFNWTTGSAVRAGTDDAVGGGSNTGLGVYYAFIQFAGFTMGKAVSQFSAPWTGFPGNNTSYLIGGQDDDSGINQFAYTAEFGNGVSGTISLEDSSGVQVGAGAITTPTGSGLYNSYNRSQLYAVNPLAGTGLSNGWGGSSVPDIVGQVRVDQAWGLFQFSAAAHQINPGSPIAGTGLGAASDTWGFAVQGALSIKNIPTGPGDSINFTAGYADGASRYIIGGVSPDSWSFAGDSNSRLASLVSSDGIIGTDGAIHKTREWGVRGAFNHNWNAHWSSSLFGSYTDVHYDGAANLAVAATSLCAPGGLAVVAGTCNLSGNISQIGTILRWIPVKNLTFSGEVMYNYINQKNTSAVVPAAVTIGNAGTLVGAVRAQRTF